MYKTLEDDDDVNLKLWTMCSTRYRPSGKAGIWTIMDHQLLFRVVSHSRSFGVGP